MIEPGQYYELKRKKHNTTIWQTLERYRVGHSFPYILEIDGELYPCLLIDSTDIGIGLYDYRIETKDFAGNMSYSDIKTVAAYDNGLRGQIDEGYARGSACYMTQLGTGNGTPGSGGGTTSPGTGLGGGPNSKPLSYDCTLVSWEYNSAYKHSLLYFKIYRVDMNAPNAIGTPNTNGQPQINYRLVKTIRIPEATETAATFPTSATYAYIDENGYKPTKEPIKYKIVAEHSDGGTSEWSVEIVVQ